ncbi:uncharacterized [Tachysurus ichikawai]
MKPSLQEALTCLEDVSEERQEKTDHVCNVPVDRSVCSASSWEKKKDLARGRTRTNGRSACQYHLEARELLGEKGTRTRGRARANGWRSRM